MRGHEMELGFLVNSSPPPPAFFVSADSKGL